MYISFIDTKFLKKMIDIFIKEVGFFGYLEIYFFFDTKNYFFLKDLSYLDFVVNETSYAMLFLNDLLSKNLITYYVNLLDLNKEELHYLRFLKSHIFLDNYELNFNQFFKNKMQNKVNFFSWSFFEFNLNKFKLNLFKNREHIYIFTMVDTLMEYNILDLKGYFQTYRFSKKLSSDMDFEFFLNLPYVFFQFDWRVPITWVSFYKFFNNISTWILYSWERDSAYATWILAQLNKGFEHFNLWYTLELDNFLKLDSFKENNNFNWYFKLKRSLVKFKAYPLNDLDLRLIKVVHKINIEKTWNNLFYKNFTNKWNFYIDANLHVYNYDYSKEKDRYLTIFDFKKFYTLRSNIYWNNSDNLSYLRTWFARKYDGYFFFLDSDWSNAVRDSYDNNVLERSCRVYPYRYTWRIFYYFLRGFGLKFWLVENVWLYYKNINEFFIKFMSFDLYNTHQLNFHAKSNYGSSYYNYDDFYNILNFSTTIYKLEDYLYIVDKPGNILKNTFGIFYFNDNVLLKILNYNNNFFNFMKILKFTSFFFEFINFKKFFIFEDLIYLENYSFFFNELFFWLKKTKSNNLLNFNWQDNNIYLSYYNKSFINYLYFYHFIKIDNFLTLNNFQFNFFSKLLDYIRMDSLIDTSISNVFWYNKVRTSNMYSYNFLHVDKEISWGEHALAFIKKFYSIGYQDNLIYNYKPVYLENKNNYIYFFYQKIFYNNIIFNYLNYYKNNNNNFNYYYYFYNNLNIINFLNWNDLNYYFYNNLNIINFLLLIFFYFFIFFFFFERLISYNSVKKKKKLQYFNLIIYTYLNIIIFFSYYLSIFLLYLNYKLKKKDFIINIDYNKFYSKVYNYNLDDYFFKNNSVYSHFLNFDIILYIYNTYFKSKNNYYKDHIILLKSENFLNKFSSLNKNNIKFWNKQIKFLFKFYLFIVFYCFVYFFLFLKNLQFLYFLNFFELLYEKKNIYKKNLKNRVLKNLDNKNFFFTFLFTLSWYFNFLIYWKFYKNYYLNLKKSLIKYKNKKFLIDSQIYRILKNFKLKLTDKSIFGILRRSSFFFYLLKQRDILVNFRYFFFKHIKKDFLLANLKNEKEKNRQIWDFFLNWLFINNLKFFFKDKNFLKFNFMIFFNFKGKEQWYIYDNSLLFFFYEKKNFYFFTNMFIGIHSNVLIIKPLKYFFKTYFLKNILIVFFFFTSFLNFLKIEVYLKFFCFYFFNFIYFFFLLILQNFEQIKIFNFYKYINIYVFISNFKYFIFIFFEIIYNKFIIYLYFFFKNIFIKIFLMVFFILLFFFNFTLNDLGLFINYISFSKSIYVFMIFLEIFYELIENQIIKNVFLIFFNFEYPSFFFPFNEFFFNYKNLVKIWFDLLLKYYISFEYMSMRKAYGINISATLYKDSDTFKFYEWIPSNIVAALNRLMYIYIFDKKPQIWFLGLEYWNLFYSLGWNTIGVRILEEPGFSDYFITAFYRDSFFNNHSFLYLSSNFLLQSYQMYNLLFFFKKSIFGFFLFIFFYLFFFFQFIYLYIYFFFIYIYFFLFNFISNNFIYLLNIFCILEVISYIYKNIIWIFFFFFYLISFIYYYFSFNCLLNNLYIFLYTFFFINIFLNYFLFFFNFFYYYFDLNFKFLDLDIFFVQKNIFDYKYHFTESIVPNSYTSNPVLYIDDIWGTNIYDEYFLRNLFFFELKNLYFFKTFYTFTNTFNRVAFFFYLIYLFILYRILQYFLSIINKWYFFTFFNNDWSVSFLPYLTWERFHLFSKKNSYYFNENFNHLLGGTLTFNYFYYYNNYLDKYIYENTNKLLYPQRKFKFIGGVQMDKVFNNKILKKKSWIKQYNNHFFFENQLNITKNLWRSIKNDNNYLNWKILSSVFFKNYQFIWFKDLDSIFFNNSELYGSYSRFWLEKQKDSNIKPLLIDKYNYIFLPLNTRTTFFNKKDGTWNYFENLTSEKLYKRNIPYYYYYFEIEAIKKYKNNYKFFNMTKYKNFKLPYFLFFNFSKKNKQELFFTRLHYPFLMLWFNKKNIKKNSNLKFLFPFLIPKKLNWLLYEDFFYKDKALLEEESFLPLSTDWSNFFLKKKVLSFFTAFNYFSFIGNYTTWNYKGVWNNIMNLDYNLFLNKNNWSYELLLKENNNLLHIYKDMQSFIELEFKFKQWLLFISKQFYNHYVPVFHYNNFYDLPLIIEQNILNNKNDSKKYFANVVWEDSFDKLSEEEWEDIIFEYSKSLLIRNRDGDNFFFFFSQNQQVSYDIGPNNIGIACIYFFIPFYIFIMDFENYFELNSGWGHTGGIQQVINTLGFKDWEKSIIFFESDLKDERYFFYNIIEQEIFDILIRLYQEFFFNFTKYVNYFDYFTSIKNSFWFFSTDDLIEDDLWNNKFNNKFTDSRISRASNLSPKSDFYIEEFNNLLFTMRERRYFYNFSDLSQNIPYFFNNLFLKNNTNLFLLYYNYNFFKNYLNDWSLNHYDFFDILKFLKEPSSKVLVSDVMSRYNNIMGVQKNWLNFCFFFFQKIKNNNKFIYNLEEFYKNYYYYYFYKGNEIVVWYNLFSKLKEFYIKPSAHLSIYDHFKNLSKLKRFFFLFFNRNIKFKYVLINNLKMWEVSFSITDMFLKNGKQVPKSDTINSFTYYIDPSLKAGKIFDQVTLAYFKKLLKNNNISLDFYLKKNQNLDWKLIILDVIEDLSLKHFLILMKYVKSYYYWGFMNLSYYHNLYDKKIFLTLWGIYEQGYKNILINDYLSTFFLSTSDTLYKNTDLYVDFSSLLTSDRFKIWQFKKCIFENDENLNFLFFFEFIYLFFIIYFIYIFFLFIYFFFFKYFYKGYNLLNTTLKKKLKNLIYNKKIKFWLNLKNNLGVIINIEKNINNKKKIKNKKLLIILLKLKKNKY